MMGIMCSERDGRVATMDDRYCIDNGAMIAWAGWLLLKEGQTTTVEEATITQRFRTDEVYATWRKQDDEIHQKQRQQGEGLLA